MSNIKLKDHNWDATGIYDSVLEKTQRQINADLTANKVNISDYTPETKTSEMTQTVGKDSNGKLWTTPVSSESIVSATEAWLADNITQETGYVIDDSLSVMGAAADAAAVGDLKSLVVDNLQAEYIDPQFVSGRFKISQQKSAIEESTKYVYSYFIEAENDIIVRCTEGYNFTVFYTAHDELNYPTAALSPTWSGGPVEYTYNPTFPYIVICARRNDGGDITTEEATNAVVATTYVKIDDGYYPYSLAPGRIYTSADGHNSIYYYVVVKKFDETGSQIPIQADYSETLSPTAYAKEFGTTITVNSGMVSGGNQGAVIKNGTIIKDTEYTEPSTYLVCLGFDKDRIPHEYPINTSAQEMIDDGIKNASVAYYRLIENGVARDISNIGIPESNFEHRPRMCLFIRENGYLGFLAIDGPAKDAPYDVSYGTTPAQTAELLLSLNAYNAWMLDGGGSTSLSIKGSKINANIDGNYTQDRNIHVTWSIPHKKDNLAIQQIYSQVGFQRDQTTVFFQRQMNKRIPIAPNEDGEYMLIATVNDGHKTYEWVER